ncbi:MAG: hypothetical protein M1835_006429 [Candelina submexicana]|nr:MAG: hypothetical protein M1835_006429 [Candelina submexicana]
MSILLKVAFAILLAGPLSLAQDCPTPTSPLKSMTDKGCFSSSGSLQDQGSNGFQSPGKCQCFCVNLGKPVMATSGGTNCWCGDLIPAASSKVDSGQCNAPCNGFDKTNCGGNKAWSVSLTGLQANVANEGGSGSSSSTQTPGSTPPTSSPSPNSPTPVIIETASVVTAGGPTVFVTAPGQSTPSSGPATASSIAPKPSSKGTNTAGIAAGVVVGIVVLAAILGGGYLFLRSRKRRAVEEEYRRNAAISSAAAADKPPGSAGSMSDSRLEPSVMMQRRQSDGSIADNQDYSRRILKVTNPDGT